MYDSVLVPVDGSNASRNAIPHAVSHAEQYNADLHIVNVISYEMMGGATAADTTGMGGVPVEMSEQMEEQANQLIEDAEDHVESTDVDVTTEVIHGNPAEQIIEYAEEQGIDLITMGTHGRSGFNRVILGSVAERVIRTAEAPVLTVRELEEEE